EELGYEVNAGLDGESHPGLQGLGQAEGLETEERTAFRTLVADVDFAVVLHVVDVEADHMTRTAGEEEGVGSRGYSLVGIAAHESELFQADDAFAGRREVYVAEVRPGREQGASSSVHAQRELVDRPLAVVEAGSDGEARTEIPGVARRGLGTRVEEKDASVLEPSVVGMSMERRALRRCDDSEGETSSRGEGYFGDSSVDVGLEHAGASRGEGRPVHVDRDRHGPVHLLDLERGLDLAKGDSGFYQGKGGSLVNGRVRPARQLGQLGPRVGAVG